jgi:protein-disulfide isomerase
MTPRSQRTHRAFHHYMRGGGLAPRLGLRIVAITTTRVRLLVALAAIATAAVVAASAATDHNQPQVPSISRYDIAMATNRAGVEARAFIDSKASTLLSAIPQHGVALGEPTAPITLQVYGDLQCLNVRGWFTRMLPRIVNEFVRTDVLRIEYHSLETDTINPKEFLTEQAAAISAAKQDKMWNFLETFYYEQGPEYTHYVTSAFLVAIAGQVPGLNIEQWSDAIDLQTANTAAKDDHFARSVGFHDTPAFRIGRTGEPLTDFAGRKVILYRKDLIGRTPSGERVLIGRSHNLMHPLSLVDWYDIKKRITELI